MARPQLGRKVPVSVGSIHVREDGPETGRPLVMVHGFTSSMHWYDDLVPLLSDTFRVVRVDLLGHGCSDRAQLMDGRSQAAMLTELLDTLGLEDAIVVGHSFGNDATVGAAVASPRVGGVVILAQGADHSEIKFPLAGRVMLMPVVGALLHRATRPFMHRSALRATFGASYHPSPATWAQGFNDFQAMHPSLHRALIVDRTRQLAERGLDVQLAESGLPALAILGQRDCFYDADVATGRYAAAGARVVVLDTGHNVQVERPQEVADLVREFAAS